MFTRRAGAGSTEARRARANGARIEVGIRGPEQKLRSRTRAGSSEDRRCGSEDVHCHFIVPAPFRKHLALTQQCCPRIPMLHLFLRSEAHALNKEY